MTTARIVGGRFALEDKPPRRGGSASVFKAADLQNGMRHVAVKVFGPSSRMDDRLLREIFNRELEGLHALNQHPNVVQLIDFGPNDGEGNPYVVLEWVEQDLLDFVGKSPVAGWDDFAHLALGIVRGIAAVHGLNRAHRDIKPENILIANDGTPKVSDFGISKLLGRLRQGMTVADLGTAPYRAPEEDDGKYSLSRDVFAFGVLVIRVMCNENLETYDDVVARLNDKKLLIDVPPEIHGFLAAAISRDPSKRPASAEVALHQLEEIQANRERAWLVQLDLYLLLTTSATEALCARMDIEPGEAMDYLLGDTQDSPALTRAQPSLGQDQEASDQDLFLLGANFRYRLRPHSQSRGVLVVIGATKFPPSELEILRSRAWQGKVIIHRTTPLDVQRAIKAIEKVQEAIAEHEQALAQKEAQDRERQLFRSWRSLLDAKRQVEEARGLPLRYRTFSVEGRRVRFELTQPAPPECVGEPRLVRGSRRAIVAGEVDDVSENVLTLFIERGDLNSLPRTGQLEYDSELAKFALDRQRDALEAVRRGRAARPDLGDLLIHPNEVTLPDSPHIGHFFETNLDEPKQRAVAAALGSKDFVLVEGPPGTGKTTFIAELVAQFLAANPGKRVLLSSQTHIALDNALDRIRRLRPNHRMLRIGRSERTSAEVKNLLIDNQMNEWREEVLKAGRKFLRAYARELGIAVPDADLAEVSGELRRVSSELHNLRSKIQNRQAERRAIADQLNGLTALSPSVLGTAERIELALRQSGPDGLREAARLYIESGLELASNLESGAGLGEKLVEAEQTLSAWRGDVATLRAAEEQLRMRLAKGLGVSSEPLPDAETLLEQAAKTGPLSDPRLEKLQGIFVEWEQRFGREGQFNGALLYRADVVAATCVGLAGIRGARDVTFDLCIVDEASKATATEALVPMSRSTSWVLVGDRNQLPPFQEEALDDPSILAKFELRKEELESTLFDYLSESLPQACKFVLTEQYRMVPAIGNLISECFYDGLLTSNKARQANPAAAALGSAVLWKTTSGLKDRFEHSAGTSYVNPLEARVIRDTLAAVNFIAEHNDAVKRSGRPIRIVVLTGYAAQRDLIRHTLDPHMLEWPSIAFEVSTVDAFQGKEADVAIFSVVRSNENGRLGFLQLSRRINVALSRGRDCLVIVGDDFFCRSARSPNNPMRRVLTHIENSADCRVEALEQ